MLATWCKCQIHFYKIVVRNNSVKFIYCNCWTHDGNVEFIHAKVWKGVKVAYDIAYISIIVQAFKLYIFPIVQAFFIGDKGGCHAHNLCMAYPKVIWIVVTDLGIIIYDIIVSLWVNFMPQKSKLLPFASCLTIVNVNIKVYGTNFEIFQKSTMIRMPCDWALRASCTHKSYHDIIWLSTSLVDLHLSKNSLVLSEGLVSTRLDIVCVCLNICICYFYRQKEPSHVWKKFRMANWQ